STGCVGAAIVGGGSADTGSDDGEPTAIAITAAPTIATSPTPIAHGGTPRDGAGIESVLPPTSAASAVAVGLLARAGPLARSDGGSDDALTFGSGTSGAASWSAVASSSIVPKRSSRRFASARSITASTS